MAIVNVNTGEICLTQSLRVGPYTTRADLFELQAAEVREVHSGGHVSVGRATVQLAGVTFIVSLYVHGERLAGLSMMALRPSRSSSWASWDQDQEELEQLHDAWLRGQGLDQ
jgi:hypothetical protein